MTQRIFDIENEKDYADLWDIVPEEIKTIYKDSYELPVYYVNTPEIGGVIPTPIGLFKINRHDKTEITRPIQECTEQDIGKICVFYDGFDETDDEPDIYAILHKIENQHKTTWFYTNRGDFYAHCRRLTKKEVSELC